MYIRQELECNGIPVVEYGYEEEEVEEEEDAPVYQPEPCCGQCFHLVQPKHLVARLGHGHGFCPLLETVRHISDKPCRLYKQDCPF